MFIEFIGKWIAGKLLGYGLETIRSSFRQPRMIEAFEKACVEVVKEESHLFSDNGAQALGSPVGLHEEECLWYRLDQSFSTNSFPDIQHLAEMLFESWKARKRQLAPSEASEFFSLSEDRVQPIIQRISEKFFLELTQIPELTNPFIVSELQRISNSINCNTARALLQSLPSPEVLKDAILKASTALFVWPTTLGNKQWLERNEVERLLDRIDTSENSTTILLGPPGSGKSALLSILGQKLKDKGVPVLAIKADKIPSNIDNLDKLSSYLKLPISADACLNQLAFEQKTVLIIDQLDALSEIVDRKSERLNVLLCLVQSASSLKNVHVVSSSRWFEFRHDTRLNTIHAEQLELTPLSWEQVQLVLTSVGVSEQNWSDDAQTMLRIPLNLKIFLDLRARNTSAELSVSLQGLLENLWQQRVLNREGASDRNLLIHGLAKRMSETEELWVPRAFADSQTDAFEDLARQEILTLDENELRIGFRHQTYFDFARARYFAQGNELLSEYVLGLQDGLFIRPILLSSLEYLRGSDPVCYQRELLALWNHPILRSHLRSLIIEFIAALEEPIDFEINCLLPVLKDEPMQYRGLLAMSGSRGWFKVVKGTILSELMSSSPDKANACLSLLLHALSFDCKAVLESLRKNWIPYPQYDALTLHVLQYLKTWNEAAVDMVCVVARRTDTWGIPYTAEIVSQLNPQLAPLIFRADLDRRYLEAEQKDAEQPISEAEPADTTSESLLVQSILNDHRKNIKELLNGDFDWHDLSAIAEGAPEAFLAQVWPWFITVLEQLADEPHPFVVGYRDDHCLGTKLDRDHGIESQPTSALRDAIVLLSESDSTAFLAFFRSNEDSSFLTVHRLLCKGLAKLAQNYPSVILEYLTNDPRRLVVGDFQDCHEESRTLISCVAPSLDKEGLEALENAVLTWDRYYRSEESWMPEDRLNRIRWNREHRLRLLRAFPDNCLSERAQRIRREEERAFPGMRDWDCQIGGFGCVESPMNTDQMQKARDSEILNLFEELVDSTEWDHPRFKKFERWVGGAIQASRELGIFAEREPARAARIAIQFKPGQQELAAGAILQGLAKSAFPSDELFQLVTRLDTAGFSGNHFRTDVARSLEIRADKDKGLPDAMLQLMESWLPTHQEPTADRIQSNDSKTDGAILWGMSGFFSMPGGRDLIFDAIAKGYLQREPQEVQGWGKVIERAIVYEQHPDVWGVILGRMPSLYNWDKVVATALFDQVLTRFPNARESITAIYAVGRIIYLVEKATLQKWLEFYRNGEWALGHQAFGELLMWYHCHNPLDAWSQNEVVVTLNDHKLIGAHRGIAFAAAYNWSHPFCQDICTSALIVLAGRSNDKAVHQAISMVFHGNETLDLNQNMRRIIEVTLTRDSLIMVSALNLIEGLESATYREPELVFNVCNRFLDAGTEEIKNPATRYAHLAEPLVSIALTLHRMPPPHRERGLLLFERLSESNIQVARQALDELDRRPLRCRSSSLPARRRRRSRRK